jgi:hypothetical protein
MMRNHIKKEFCRWLQTYDGKGAFKDYAAYYRAHPGIPDQELASLIFNRFRYKKGYSYQEAYRLISYGELKAIGCILVTLIHKGKV